MGFQWNRFHETNEEIFIQKEFFLVLFQMLIMSLERDFEQAFQFMKYMYM